MATVQKFANKASASNAIRYALGEKKKLKNNSEEWFEENNIISELGLENYRAVAVGGSNGLNPFNASNQMKWNRQHFGKTQAKNQALAFIQSFDLSELDPKKAEDRRLANEMGVELAEKMFPEYQAGVYTHIDGKNHIIHNHIVVDNVNLTTGNKMRNKRGTGTLIEKVRAVNDEVIAEHGFTPLPKAKELVSQAEKDLRKKGEPVWKDELRIKINEIILKEDVNSLEDYKRELGNQNISYKERGKGGTYTYVHENNKGETVTHKVRESKLGEEYTRTEIENELNHQRINDSESRTESEERDIDPIVERERHSRKTTSTEVERADKAIEECSDSFEQSAPVFSQLKTGIAASIRDFADWAIRKARELSDLREQAKRTAEENKIADYFNRFKNKTEKSNDLDEENQKIANYFAKFKNKSSEESTPTPPSKDFEGPEL